MATVARRPHYGEADHAGLPRFQLPNESSDPLDLARTIERPSLRNLVRGSRKRVVDAPSEPDEVAPEDILMEVYADPPASRMPATKRSYASLPPPPPPGKRTAPPPPITERLPMSSGPSNAYFASELIGTPLPAEALGGPMSMHPVDALMAIPPPPTPASPPVSVGPNSIAPVVYAPSRPTPVYEIRVPQSRSSARALWTVALVGLVILAGIAIAITVPRGPFGRGRTAAAAPPPPPPPPVTIVVPAPPPPAPTVVPPVAPFPTVSVDALPAKPAIEPNMTLITFPASAVGHRVYVDKGILLHSPEQAMVKCGKHKIRIGSEGKARKVDCPCGGELVLE